MHSESSRAGGWQLGVGEQLMHIAHALGEAFGFGVVGRVAKQQPVLLHRGAAARRVHGDVVHLAERCEEPSGVAPRVVG
jgi:hypothetical protein